MRRGEGRHQLFDDDERLVVGDRNSTEQRLAHAWQRGRGQNRERLIKLRFESQHAPDADVCGELREFDPPLAPTPTRRVGRFEKQQFDIGRRIDMDGSIPDKIRRRRTLFEQTVLFA